MYKSLLKESLIFGIIFILIGVNISTIIPAKSNKVSSNYENPLNLKIIKPAKGINIGNVNIFPFPDKIIYINFGFQLDLHWKVEVDNHSNVNKVEFYVFDTFIDSDDEYPYEGIFDDTVLRLFANFPIRFIAYDNTGNHSILEDNIYFIIIPIPIKQQ